MNSVIYICNALVICLFVFLRNYNPTWNYDDHNDSHFITEQEYFQFKFQIQATLKYCV